MVQLFTNINHEENVTEAKDAQKAVQRFMKQVLKTLELPCNAHGMDIVKKKNERYSK